MRKWLLGFVVCVAVLFVGAGLALPKTFHLSRQVTIAKHPARVVPLIERMDKWESWWPWDQKNAGRRLSLETNKMGEGATLSWSGHPSPGSLTLTDSSIFKIQYKVQFDRNSTSDSGAFLFLSSSNATEVTWEMDGHFESPILGGYLALIADAMHGGMLDWGLENIKELAEGDTSALNLYYMDEQGREVKERID